MDSNSVIDQFYIDYIKAIENPDKIGWNGKVWTAPTLKGYDQNQRGYGIDINKNIAAKKLTEGRSGKWLSEKEANDLMLQHIKYVYNAAQKHIQGFNNLSTKRKAALLGMLYRGDSVNANKDTINIMEPDDNKFFSSISSYYKTKGLNERAKNSDNFFLHNKQPNYWNTIPQWSPPMPFKQGGKMVRKMQTASGGPIKRQKDGFRYISDEKGGWTRISDNDVSDIFSTIEVKPNKVTTGSDITRKQQKPISTYRSAYNPGDIIKGFNALTLGGLNNLSPTQWIGRYKDLNKLLISQMPGTKRSMTWSGFVNNWLNGNSGVVSEKFAQEHPYWTLGINGVGDAIALGGLSNASKVKQVGDIVGNRLDKTAKIAIDVAKNSPKPFNWRNYRFLGDFRFYSDLDDAGYKTIMSERKLGNYPLTTAERRNYITGLKNDIQKGVDYAINEAKENVKVPLKKGKEVEYTFNGSRGWRWDPYTPEDIQPQKIHYGTLKTTNSESGKLTPWEGSYGAFQGDDGLFFPFRDKANTLRTHSMFQNVGERVGTGAHETRHTIQSYFDTPLTETRYDMPGNYGRYTNRNLPLDFKKKVNSFISDAETAGEWKGSLSEMDAELTGWRAQYNLPRYSEMNPQQKARVYNLFQKRFGGVTDYNDGAFKLLDKNKILNSPSIKSAEKNIDNSKIGQILTGLEMLGYRKQGGKMNLIDFLKKGSGIHIKKENRGKFTDYCGGKVTSECIAKGKSSSNPTIRKRATFAANARKWKHEKGGELIKKAQEGTKLNFGQKVGNFIKSDFGKSAMSMGLNLLSNKLFNQGVSSESEIAKSQVDSEQANEEQQAVALAQAQTKQALANLENPDNPNANGGDIVKSNLYQKFLSQNLIPIQQKSQAKKAQIDMQTQQFKNQKSQEQFSQFVNTGLDLINTALNHKKV